MNHGMPHFENMDASRGPPVVAKDLMRNIGKRDQLAWKHVELIRRRWKGKLVVKGLIAPADARIARESGVDGVIVSNHGGRQLDCTVSSLRTLPEIAALANGMTVMLDGGIRRGTDVLKALALGAQFVFIGRPFLFAAVAAGEAGVQRALTCPGRGGPRHGAPGHPTHRRGFVRAGSKALVRLVEIQSLIPTPARHAAETSMPAQREWTLLFSAYARQDDRDVRRGADDPRASIGINRAPLSQAPECFQKQNVLLGEHGAPNSLIVRPLVRRDTMVHQRCQPTELRFPASFVGSPIWFR